MYNLSETIQAAKDLELLPHVLYGLFKGAREDILSQWPVSLSDMQGADSIACMGRTRRF